MQAIYNKATWSHNVKQGQYIFLTSLPQAKLGTTYRSHQIGKEGNRFVEKSENVTLVVLQNKDW